MTASSLGLSFLSTKWTQFWRPLALKARVPRGSWVNSLASPSGNPRIINTVLGWDGSRGSKWAAAEVTDGWRGGAGEWVGRGGPSSGAETHPRGRQSGSRTLQPPGAMSRESGRDPPRMSVPPPRALNASLSPALSPSAGRRLWLRVPLLLMLLPRVLPAEPRAPAPGRRPLRPPGDPPAARPALPAPPAGRASPFCSRCPGGGRGRRLVVGWGLPDAPLGWPGRGRRRVLFWGQGPSPLQPPHLAWAPSCPSLRPRGRRCFLGGPLSEEAGGAKGKAGWLWPASNLVRSGPSAPVEISVGEDPGYASHSGKTGWGGNAFPELGCLP